MTNKELDKNAARRLVIIRHAQEATGDWPRVGLPVRWRHRSPYGSHGHQPGREIGAGAGPTTRADIEVHEFAMPDDGRRLTLRQRRGFSTSATLDR